MPERGPLIERMRTALLMGTFLTDQGRKFAVNLVRSHPERPNDAVSPHPFTAGSVATELWAHLSRSPLYPDQWEMVLSRIEDMVAVLHRLYLALKNEELCASCTTILTDGEGFRDYLPTLHTAKVWIAHEDLDRWVDQVGKNGGTRAIDEALDSRHNCLTHRNRVWVQWYDEGWKPRYDEQIQRPAVVAS